MRNPHPRKKDESDGDSQGWVDVTNLQSRHIDETQFKERLGDLPPKRSGYQDDIDAAARQSEHRRSEVELAEEHKFNVAYIRWKKRILGIVCCIAFGCVIALYIKAGIDFYQGKLDGPGEYGSLIPKTAWFAVSAAIGALVTYFYVKKPQHQEK